MSTAFDFEYDVYLCHSSRDKRTVKKLAMQLKKDGLKVLMNAKHSIGKTRTLVLIMSPNTFGSDWEKLERQTLPFRDPADTQRCFVPLLIEKCDVPEVIAQFTHIDWRNRSQEEYQNLLEACQYEEKTTSSKKDIIYIKEPLILKGHTTQAVNVSITPDGKRAVSSSWDKTLKVWDLESGKCITTITGDSDVEFGVAATPDGKRAVSGSTDNTLKVWDLESGKCITKLEGHTDVVRSIAITPDGKRTVSGSDDKTLKVWDLESGKCLMTLRGHTDSICNWALAVTADGKRAVSGSVDKTVKIWDLETGQCLSTLKGHTEHVYGVTVTPDGKHVVSASSDKTLKVWDLESEQCLATLEGHTGLICGVGITPDGKRVVSGSGDSTLKVWDLETGQCLATLRGHTGKVYGIAVTPDGKQVVSSSSDGTLRVWNLLDIADELEVEQSTRYTNAKVVIVGESGAGKTGLAIRLAEDRWEITESTHGMRVWQLELPQISSDMEMKREVLLWDFAGQPDYRLIHQLYMDETALALVVMDPQQNDPFANLGHWEKALKMAVGDKCVKILAAARCDCGGITVSRQKVDGYRDEHDYRAYQTTSAKTGEGCKELKDIMADHIPWNNLPWTSTTRLFKILKDSILVIRYEGAVLIRISELRQRLQLQLKEITIKEEDLRAVVGLLSGQGIIQMLAFGDFVLLKPEYINRYASVVVRSARENIDEIGSVPKRDILEGCLDYKDMKRLSGTDEKILLRAMLQTFLDRSLCLEEDTQEGTQLVFPSYFNRDRPEQPTHPGIMVAYEFSGPVDEIYTTLVVRLYYTNDFQKDELWKNAADFKTLAGKQAGLLMEKQTDESAQLKVYFEANVPEDTKVSFIKYIHEHLLKRADQVKRIRYYICPHCHTPLDNYQAIQRRINSGKKDILCTDCEKRILLIDQVEKKFASDELLRAVQEMDEHAKRRLDNESLMLILEGQARAIAGEAGQIYRDTPHPDWGIDAEIEFKNDKGEASGKRVYLQLKSGDSYLYKRKGDDREIYYIRKERHAEYWVSQAYPVMLVIRGSDGKIRWMNVTEYLKKAKGTKQIVFEGEPFTALNLSRLRDNLF